ncbi:MAG: PAS domain S-box protein [Rhodocyclales bacterium]|nr:PAS domain S-box protein [Rhodocyclales bacterium]
MSGAIEAFVWNEHMATGIPEVDDDHRALIRIVNEIGHLHSRSTVTPDLSAEYDHLKRHARTHFDREERAMRDRHIDPRHVEAHSRLHRDFIGQLEAMRDNNQHDVSALQHFIMRWLIYHTLGVDLVMAHQVEYIQAGMDPAAAFDKAGGDGGDPATNGLLKALGLERERTDEVRRDMQQRLGQIIEGDPVPTFVIDAEHRVTHWNRACELVTGVKAADIVGTRNQWRAFYAKERPVMADLIVNGALEELFEAHYKGRYRRSKLADDIYEAEDFFPQFGDSGYWLFFTAAPVRDLSGNIVGAIETLQDVTDRHKAEEALRRHQEDLERVIATRTAELAEANRRMAEDLAMREQAEAELLRRYAEVTRLNVELSQAKEQLTQSEKMASIGQLAAGVAHEINNPIGYVYSNIGSLESFLSDLFRILGAYEVLAGELPDSEAARAARALRSELDLDFLKEDIPALLKESKEGITRVKKIVQDLKDFSHVDSSQEWQWTNLHRGLDSTLNIVNNEIKYKADVVKEYGALPDIECLPSQLNQVFMNLLVNAAHAMGAERGTITVRTGVAGDKVWVEIVDTGSGIPPEVRQRIFDPFFTTKPIGKGTGLGLSLSYGIVQKHHGTIEVVSEPGRGSTFRITLPVEQPKSENAP